MKLDVTELLRETGTEAVLTGEMKLKFPKEEIELAAPIKYDLKVLNSGVSILIKGRIETEIAVNCVRCMKRFNKKIICDIDEEYSKNLQAYNNESKEKELSDKDFVYEIDADNNIDIDEVLRQNLIMAIPMRAICSSSCRPIEDKGSKRIDPRLEKLKDLIPKKK